MTDRFVSFFCTYEEAVILNVLSFLGRSTQVIVAFVNKATSNRSKVFEVGVKHWIKPKPARAEEHDPQFWSKDCALAGGEEEKKLKAAYK